MSEECDHKLLINGYDAPDHLGRRHVDLICEKCDYSIQMLSTRSDAEIKAEIEASR